MIEVYVNGYKLDLYDKTKVAQTFQVNSLAELKDRQAGYSNNIRIPKTPNNVKALDYLGVVGSTSDVPYRSLEAKIVINGIETTREGLATTKKTDKDYNLVIYEGLKKLFETIKEKTINELNYQDLNHYLDAGLFVQSQQNTEGYIYALADFGLGINTTIEVEESAPSVFSHTIFDKIFKEQGFDYEFDNEDFKNEVVAPAKGYEIGSDTFVNTILGTITSNTISEYYTQDGFYRQDFTLSGTLQLPEIVSGNLKPNFTGTLVLTLNITSGVTNGNAFVDVLINGNLASTLPASGTFTKNLLVQPNDIISMRLVFYTSLEDDFLDPSSVTCSFTGALVRREGGFFINVASILPEVSQKDFIKDIMQRYGLIMGHGDDTNTYKFVRIQDLLNDFNNAETINIIDQSEVYKFGSYAQRNVFAYKYPDEIVERDYDGTLLIDNETLPEEKTLFTSPYEIALEVPSVYQETMQSVPIWELKDGVVTTTETTPKLFTIKRKTVNLSYRYFSTNLLTLSINTAFLTKENIGYQGFIEKHYASLTEILTKPKVITATAYLTVLDIYRRNFFSLKYIPELGRYFYLNRIINFIHGKPTKIELIEVKDRYFNKAPSALGSMTRSVSNSGNYTITLENILDGYYDPEGDPAQTIRILNGFNSDILIKQAGVTITAQTDIDVADWDVTVQDVGNTNDAHSAIFEFAVKDSGSGSFSTVVGAININVPQVINQAPVANAGADFTVFTNASNTLRTLQGCNSYDPNGGLLQHLWTINITDTALTLSSATSCNATLHIDDDGGGLNGTVITATLRVTDTGGLYDEDTVQITINSGEILQ